jgi:hypothetical protein
MKRTNYFILAFAAFAALVGCVKEEQNSETPESQFLTVNAAVDGAVVKTWNSGDVIKVVCGEEMYDFKTSETAANAKFIQSEEKLTAEMIGDAGVAAFANCRTMYGAFNISPEQTWTAGASSVAVPAYAYTMNAPVENVLALDFNALASVIELTFTPYSMTIRSLKLEASEETTITEGALAGAFLAPFMYGLYWKGVTRASVWASFVAGVGITVANMFFKFIASPINAGAAAMVAGMIVVPVVSLITPKMDKNKVEECFTCLEETVVVHRKTSIEE